jgi:hypothetical protein
VIKRDSAAELDRALSLPFGGAVLFIVAAVDIFLAFRSPFFMLITQGLDGIVFVHSPGTEALDFPLGAAPIRIAE